MCVCVDVGVVWCGVLWMGDVYVFKSVLHNVDEGERGTSLLEFYAYGCVFV